MKHAIYRSLERFSLASQINEINRISVTPYNIVDNDGQANELEIIPPELTLESSEDGIPFQHHNSVESYLWQSSHILFKNPVVKPLKPPVGTERFVHIKPVHSEQLPSLDQPSDDLENVKYRAIKQIWCQLSSQLSMLDNEHRCRNEPFANIEMPHNFFSWNMDDCLSRRSFSLEWCNLLQKQLSSKCLEMRKIMSEYTELKRLTSLILDQYFQLDSSMHEVLRELLKAVDYINLLPILKQELINNTATVNEDIHKLLAVNFIRRVSDTNNVTVKVESNECDDLFWQKSLFRYVRQYYAAKEDQNQIDSDSKELYKKAKLNAYNTSFKSEIYCAQSSLNYYHNEHQILKLRLINFGKKYDKDYDEVASTNTYRKLSIQNLKTRQQLLVEQFNDIHARINQFKAAQIAEQQKAEIERQRAKAEAEANNRSERKLPKRKKEKSTKKILKHYNKKAKKNL